MSDLPPLPETDDPHQLLGVGPEASEREVRAAYARLIKQYRPDRAPNAFQRIHAAYEQLRAIGEGASHIVAEAARRAVAADAPPPVDRSADTAAAADAIRAAIDGDDARATDDAIERAITDGVPIDDVLEQVAPEQRDVVLDAGGLTWGRLVAHHDRVVAYALVLAAVRRRLELPGAPGVERVFDKTFFDDAPDDEALARLGWFAAGALAWHRPIDDFTARLAKLPRDDATEGVIDTVGLDLDAATELRRSGRDLPSEVLALLHHERLGTTARRTEAAAAIAAAAQRDPVGWLRAFDAIANDRPALAGALHARFVDSTLVARATLPHLPEDRFRELSGALYDAGRGLRWFHLVGGAIAGVGAGWVIAPIGAALAAGAAGIGGASFLATETQRYRTRIRPRLVEVAARVGVNGACISRWIQLNGRIAGRLGNYSIAIDDDLGLHLAAGAAAWAASVGDDP